MQVGAGGSALITGKDLLVMVGLSFLTPIAWLVPEARWHRLTGGTLMALASVGAGPQGKLRGRLERYFGDRAPAPLEAMAAHALAYYADATLQVLRAHRPGGWTPAVELVGAEHLHAALERGRGAILWISFFQFYSLISKIAPHRAGFAVSHLSHPRHGFSSSRFGVSVLNRLYRDVEDRYLRERVRLSIESPLPAMRTLARRLEANGIVSITAREAASQPVVVPFLSGRIPVASGAPDLAYRTGAALLPMHTVRNADGRFSVIVEPSVAPVERGDDRRAFSESAVRAYAARLEDWVSRYPDQWRGWFHLGSTDSAETAARR